MALSIPPRYVSRIRQILDLNDVQCRDLERALASSEIKAKPKDMAEQVANNVPAVAFEALVAVIDGLYALYRVREYSDLNRKSFQKELIESIKLDIAPSFSEEQISEVGDRFERLLNIETLESLSKAVVLQRDGERIYCGSRVLTDIRPVFGRKDDSSPLAAVITHTLKISYHEAGKHKEVYCVLDEEDLQDLRTAIERAEAKAHTIDEYLSKINLVRLGI